MDTLKLLRDVTMGNITVEENDGIFEFSNGEKIKVIRKLYINVKTNNNTII